MPATSTLSPTATALAVFDAVRTQSAWEALPASQLATEARDLIPALREALASTPVEVGPARVSQGVFILTTSQLHRRHVVVGVILAKALHHDIPPHDAYWQLLRELRTAIARITAVDDPVDF